MAAMQHFGLAREDLDGRLFIDSGMEAHRRVMLTKGGELDKEVFQLLNRRIDEQSLALVVFDPFVSLHQLASENDVMKIDALAKRLAEMAGIQHAAIGLVHHTRKAARGAVESQTIDDARGAGSPLAGARAGRRNTGPRRRARGRLADRGIARGPAAGADDPRRGQEARRDRKLPLLP